MSQTQRIPKDSVPYPSLLYVREVLSIICSNLLYRIESLLLGHTVYPVRSGYFGPIRVRFLEYNVVNISGSKITQRPNWRKDLIDERRNWRKDLIDEKT